MSDIAKLEEVASFLREHPDLHGQGSYVCDTTACVAGWTWLLGQHPNWWRDTDTGDNPASLLRFGAGPATVRFATAALGLSTRESWQLFNGTNSHGDHLECGNYSKADKVAQCPVGLTAEDRALTLMGALIERDKDSLSPQGRAVLEHYALSVTPAPR